ncbi:MAG: Holliday junction branch migration protein RuvA [Clostridia bacterium]
MYNYIIGKVADIAPNKIVVENNGIGYEIGVSGNTVSDIGEAGKTVKIFTYQYVREDVIALYGFSKLEEKTLFLRLINISGIGPKMGMQILGGYDLKTLTIAIATGDIKTLTKIKGLGKKTAELLILNLREQVAVDLTDVTSSFGGELSQDIQDAIFALTTLGISNTEAVKAVNEIARTVNGVENIISTALKRLA